MFKSFQQGQQFKGFPNLNFQMNNEAYGFSGCTLWLDAAWGLNTQTNNTLVSQWNTKVGGFVFSQATAANQPTFYSVAVEYNGLPIVQSNGTSQFLSTTSNILNFKSVAFVANYNTLASTNNVVLGSQLGVNQSFGMGGSAAANTGVFYFDGTYYTTTLESITPKICVFTPTGIWVNGVKELTANMNFLSWNSLFRPNNNNHNLLGGIAEVLCYNYDMSNDAVNLSAKLNTKYALY